MVAKVYGKCDGQTIMFHRNADTGRWETAVPFDKDGEYVVEIRAVDDCGNEGYYATLLFTVDTTKLCVKVKVLHLSSQAKIDGAFTAPAKIRTSRYHGSVFQSQLCGPDWQPLYQTKLRLNKWRAGVVRCELCGRF